MPRVCSVCGLSIGSFPMLGGCPFCGGELKTISENQAESEGIKSVFETPLFEFMKERKREFNQTRKIRSSASTTEERV